MSGLLIVTGASAGIGAATARMAPAQGWARVVVHYGRDRDGAESVASDIRAAGAEPLVRQADVADPAALAALFDDLRTQAPGPVGLVNNAGIVGRKASLPDLTPERVARLFSINVLGAFEVARLAVALMRDWGRGGGIVNVSSVASRLGAAHQYVDYAATKGAIDAMTLGLADELAPDGIRVNAIRPSLIETGIHAKGGDPDRLARLGGDTPLGRAGTAQECAEAILWLLSDRSSYVTRTLLDVAGGR